MRTMSSVLKAQTSDGFTFSVVFSTEDLFIQEQVQLQLSDRHLAPAGSNAQIAVFMLKVDELSLLTVGSSIFSPVYPSRVLGPHRSARFSVEPPGLKISIRSIISPKVHGITGDVGSICRPGVRCQTSADISR